MKKRVAKLFLLIFFGLSLFICGAKGIKADAGFDNDYDGGSWGGSSGGGGSWGGSYDDDDDWHSSSNSSGDRYYSSSGEPLTGWPLAIVLFVGIASIVLPIGYLVICEYSRNVRYPSNPEVNVRGLPVDDDLNCQVFDLYKALNVAWMNKDLEPVRHLLTDELYNMYLMQLDTLIEANQTNVMERFRFVSGHIKSKRRYKGIETITMIFRVTCKDYITNDKGKVIRGNSHTIWDYTYEMKLVRKYDNKPVVCPNCNYTFKKNDGQVCPHCETIVHSPLDTLKLADKNMLRQSKGGW